MEVRLGNNEIININFGPPITNFKKWYWRILTLFNRIAVIKSLHCSFHFLLKNETILTLYIYLKVSMNSCVNLR